MKEIQLCDKMTCTQCMACVNACPKGCIMMVDAGEGFAVPHIDESTCIKCGVCMSSCHQLENKLERHRPIKTLACWTKLRIDRKKSSSGGAFSVLARKVLSQDGVVFGVTMSKDLKVLHIAIERVEDLHKLQGSKYVQSYLGDTFIQVRNYLKKGRLVLFTGTPCQIGGLLTFLHKKYENLITCDMICHGVPSQRSFDAFCERTHLSGTCDAISFRFTEGWGYQLAREWQYPSKDGDYSSVIIKRKPIFPSKAWYMNAFNNGLMFNEACYTCSYTQLERVSDFTMADYWGLGKKVPFNHPTFLGVSLLLVNTPKAVELLNKLPELYYEERDIHEAIEGNYNLSHSTIRSNYRNMFIKDLYDMNKKNIAKQYGLTSTARDYIRLLKQLIFSKS